MSLIYLSQVVRNEPTKHLNKLPKKNIYQFCGDILKTDKDNIKYILVAINVSWARVRLLAGFEVYVVL